jgi:hypothetical protein
MRRKLEVRWMDYRNSMIAYRFKQFHSIEQLMCWVKDNPEMTVVLKVVGE